MALTDGLDTQVRKSDRAAVAKATEAEVSTVIKPEAASALNSVLADADRQGVTIFPLALPSGDPKRLPLPDPRIIAQYSAARTRLQMLADRTGGQVTIFGGSIRWRECMPRWPRTCARFTASPINNRTRQTRDGKWREIRVDVTRPN